MLNIDRWKIVLVMAVSFLGLLYASPNLMSETQRQWAETHLPSWAPHSTINLGLDLRGGSHLLYELDVEPVVKDRIQSILDAAKIDLRKEKIEFTDSAVKPDGITFKLVNAEQDRDAAYAIARNLHNDTDVNMASDGTVTVVLTQKGLMDIRKQVIDQSIEIVRRRVDESGTKEPLIQRQGDNRIVVQLPGIDDPEHVKTLIGTTAKMNFHLLDLESAGEAGPGSVKLPMREGEGRSLVVMKRPAVKGELLTDAQPSYDQNGEPVVSFKFDSMGAKRFCDVSRDNVGKPFAIVLDDQIISAPVINEPICGGAGQISGHFDVKGANDLALLLRAGALPAEMKVVEERSVGPTLGSDSIAAGKHAALVAFVAVLVLMAASYGLFGIFADIALAFNIVFIFAVLSILQATLTLPGIAGIILTIGIAVDANVLIYERIREEIRQGRSVISSIETGYKMALPTIIDANLTTLIVALILFSFGSGPIKGFAVAMSIGIVTSMFSAIMLTRLMVITWLKKTRPSTLALERHTHMKFRFRIVKEKTHIDFMGVHKFTLALSVLMMLTTITLLFTKGLNLGIDFTGGILIEIQKPESMHIEDIRRDLEGLSEGTPTIQEFGGGAVMIKIPGKEADTEQQKAIYADVQSKLPGVEFRRTEYVGPQVGGELIMTGVKAFVWAMVAILAYIWVRFEWQFGLTAVLALIHDGCATMLFFILTGFEFDLSTVAAVLLISGYSLNETVVVFDRIREMLRKYRKMPLPELLNLALNDTLSRTLMTSLATFTCMACLAVFGTEAIKGFSYAMLVGIFFGPISSNLVSSPLLLYLNLRREPPAAIADPAETNA